MPSALPLFAGYFFAPGQGLMGYARAQRFK